MTPRVIEVSADRVEFLLTAILVVLLVWFLAWLVEKVPRKQSSAQKSTKWGGSSRYDMGDERLVRLK